MRTRFSWLIGVLALILIGFLLACGSHFSSTSDGLVIVPNLGSATVQAFSFALNNGRSSQINTAPPTPGIPSAVVLDPAGTFAYAVVQQATAIQNSITGIATYKVNSDGTLSAIGQASLHPANVQVCVAGQLVSESVAVSPQAATFDSTGKFLFVSDGATIDAQGNTAPGAVSVLAVGSNASLTEVTNSPFTVPASCAGVADFRSLAVSPTVFPAVNAVCVGQTAPSAANLYVADASNNVLWEFGVDPTSGALTNPPFNNALLSFPTGTVPSGVAVDACNRFVYVSNGIPNNNISAYTICSAVLLPTCPLADGSLRTISGSPFAVNAIGPGPIAIDPFGNFVYVLSTPANTISAFKIGAVNGALTAITPATQATGAKPVALTIRGDDTWLFVANYDSGTLSQFSITPATGQLNPGAAITTDNNPTGVAVK